MHNRSVQTNPGEGYVRALLEHVEDVDSAAISFLLTITDPLLFPDIFRRMIRVYKEKTGTDLFVDFTFDVNDPCIPQHFRDTPAFLRFLKGLMEVKSFRAHIKSIVVKGPAGTVELEPSVFSSGIRFERLV